MTIACTCVGKREPNTLLLVNKAVTSSDICVSCEVVYASFNRSWTICSGASKDVARTLEIICWPVSYVQLLPGI